MPYHQFTITTPEKLKDRIIEKLTQLGSLGVIEREDAVVAYFPDTIPRSAITQELDIIRLLLNQVDSGLAVNVRYEIIPDEDWGALWKESFKPLVVGDSFLIVPPWEHSDSDRIKLVIDPGMAFGTGHHETTRSCLLFLEQYAERTERRRFLDIGTGTGILAIAAAKIGFRNVIGIDNDPLAIEAAKSNCINNGIHNVELKVGDITGIKGQYDFITANLYSGLLIQLAPKFGSLLHTPGLIVIAGMLIGQEHDVREALTKEGILIGETKKDGKWISMVLKR